MAPQLRLVQRVGVRAFHSSRVRLSGGHGPHYPEGPRSNIPWTPKGKWNIRAKIFGVMSMSVVDCAELALGFSLPIVAAWWQLSFPCLRC
jgi:Cytochrome c oxidase subunit VIIc